MRMQKYTDQELIAKYLETKKAEFLTELFTRHSDIVYRTALRIMRNASDAEDIMQTVYCKLITNLHMYKGTGSVVGWMLQIVIHTCYNQLDSEKSRTKREKKIMSERRQTYDTPSNDLKETIEKHLNKLPEIYKTPITLQIMEGLTIKEVSDALEIPEKTVRSQIARGLEKLKTSLQNVGITASVVMIGDSLKQLPLTPAPASVNSGAFFQSIIKSKAATSTKLAVTSSSKYSFGAKLISFLVIAGISVTAYFTWSMTSNSNKNFVGTDFLQQQWSFENVTEPSEYQGIGLASGNISISDNKGVSGSKCLEIDDDTTVELDVSKYEFPLVVTYQVDVLAKDSLVNNLMFNDRTKLKGRKMPFFTSLRERLNLTSNQSDNKKEGYTGNWFTQEAYVDHDSYDCWVNGKRSHVLLGADIDKTKLYIHFKSKALVDNLVIKSIPKNKLPDKKLFKEEATKHSYVDDSNFISIDKTHLGFDSQTMINPILKFLTAKQTEGWNKNNEPTFYAHLGKNNRVIWRDVNINYKWDFENTTDISLYQNIGLVHGGIQIKESIGTNGTHGLEASASTVLALDISNLKLPLKVSLNIDFFINTIAAPQRIFRNKYNKNQTLVELSELRQRIAFDLNKNSFNGKNGYTGNWYNLEIYIDEKSVDFWLNGSRSNLILGESNDTKTLFLYLEGQSVLDDLKIEQVDPNSIPDNKKFRDMIQSISRQEGVTEYFLDKEKCGLPQTSTAKPNAIFREHDFYDVRLELQSEVSLPNLGKDNQVEWNLHRRKISKKLAFEKFEDVAEFKLVHGSIVMAKERGENKSHCLSIDKNSVFSLDISEYHLPLKISFSFDLQIKPDALENGTLLLKDNLKPNENIFNITNLQVTKYVGEVSMQKKIKSVNENQKDGFMGFWNSKVIYVTNEYADIWFEGKRSGIIFQKSLDDKKLYFYILDTALIDNITIESIEPEALPDISKFQKYISKIPFQKEPRSFPLDKKELELDKDSNAYIRIYDREYIEKALDLENIKPIEVLKDPWTPKPR